MEFLEELDDDIMLSIVQLIPNVLYWAVVDVPALVSRLKGRPNIKFYKPSRTKEIPPRNFLTGTRSKSPTIDIDENNSRNASPSKRRSARSSVCKARVCVNFVYTDKVFVYEPLTNDFGPLDLPTTMRYIDFMDTCISDSNSNVYIHVSDFRHPRLCSNSAFLAAVYTYLRTGHTVSPSAVSHQFASVPPQYLPPFRDASSAPRCSFPLTLKDMLEAVAISIKYRWINWESFDVCKAEYFQHVHNGDMNWILENQFLAFAGPATDGADEDGFDVLTPNHYVEIFPNFGITDVVRLNIPNYDPSEFSSFGIRHHDLFFEDGSCPSIAIVNAFLNAADTAQGAVAVHCKAGLGRSVTLIGAHVIRNYKVPAKIFIAWARIARPGSVIGPQQHFLVEIQPYLWNSNVVKSPSPPSRKLRALGSDSYIGKHGDEGQASRLLSQKRQRRL